jgi:RNA polymerase primary sigma factor
MSMTPPQTPSKRRAGGLRKLRPSFELPNALNITKLTSPELEALKDLRETVWECVYHPDFERARAENNILKTAPRPADYISYERQSEADLDSEFGVFANMRAEVLTAEQERHLFMAFNYCRFRVMKTLRKFRGERLTLTAARDLVQWYHHSLTVRGEIARLNISLVLAMARRAKINGVELSELVSEGNFALLRCVDKFDVNRGFKFSTYACRAILSAFTRIATKGSRYRQQFPVAFDNMIERSDHLERKREETVEHSVLSLRNALERNTADLSDVERKVLSARFALDDESVTNPGHARGKTLEEVGSLLGVSKERVRQIQNKALEKLRDVLAPDYYADAEYMPAKAG